MIRGKPGSGDESRNSVSKRRRAKAETKKPALRKQPAQPAASGLGGATEKLMDLMARLRGPGGCPWDRAQNYDSMKALLLEEAYEVIDAAGGRDFDALEDELGDLLFQVVFYARLAEEEGRFTLESVMSRLHGKLVRRHPHVFGKVKARTAAEALKSWNTVKDRERAARPERAASLLDGMAATLPATLEAHELGLRVAEAGFDWRTAADVLDKVQEEVDELRAELGSRSWDLADSEARTRAAEELGDLLFSLSQFARHLGSDPESCLRRGNQKFRRRFQAVERQLQQRGRRVTDCDLDELEEVWCTVKAAERQTRARRAPE
jgi:nucleoside triphosphate diphosphatase